MKREGFELLCRWDHLRVPLLVHIPHSSTHITVEVRQGILLNQVELERELLSMTDRYTDQLFDHAIALGGALFVNRLSRLVVDPERFADDAEEVMASRGMGAVYTKTSAGQALRREGEDGERQDLLRRYFSPYAEAMTRQVEQILSQHGRCLILDGHSFPSRPLPYELDQSPERPEICIGTDPFHTPDALVLAIEHLCASSRVGTARNRPFAGTYVPLQFCQKDARVMSLMIEIRRDLYMDETTGACSSGFKRVHQLIDQIVRTAAGLVS